MNFIAPRHETLFKINYFLNENKFQLEKNLEEWFC